MEQVGYDLEAVAVFEEYYNKRDKFFIYKLNDRRGNPV